MTQTELIVRKIVEKVTRKVFRKYEILNEEPLFEMARINLREFGNVPFPTNKFEIKIWSNDHNPPHFHVISEGWDIAFEIETGKVVRVKKCGSQSSLYDYIVKNVPNWLNMKCKITPSLTNRDNAMSLWHQMHDEE